MPSTGHKGIDVRQTTTRLMFRALLQDSAGAIVTGGATNLRLYELQSDGSLLSYDFADNTFKAGALGTETLAMTHRAGNNGATNTGLWTAALTTLTGFTAGAIYFSHVTNTGAFPVAQAREFQFGQAQGDDTAQSGDAYVIVNDVNNGNAAIKTAVNGLPTDADVQAAAAAAIVAYDPPTHAELTAALAGVTVMPAPGAKEWPYLVNNTGTGLPESGVEVWFTTVNLSTATPVWRGVTDSFGYAKDVFNHNPWLDLGTYYVWKHKSGFQDPQFPDTEVVI